MGLAEGDKVKVVLTASFDGFSSAHFLEWEVKEEHLDPHKFIEKISQKKALLFQGTTNSLESLELLSKNYAYVLLEENLLTVVRPKRSLEKIAHLLAMS